MNGYTVDGANTALSAFTDASNTMQSVAETMDPKPTSYGQTLSKMGCGTMLASMTNIKKSTNSNK